MVWKSNQTILKTTPFYLHPSKHCCFILSYDVNVGVQSFILSYDVNVNVDVNVVVLFYPITFSTKQLNFRISVWRNNRNDTFNVHPKAQIQHSNYPQKRSNSKNLCFLYPCIGCWLKHNQCRCFSLTWWTIIVCFFILAVMGMLTGQAFPSLFLRSASGFSLSSQELESALNLTFDPISHMQTHLHRVMNGLSVTCIWIRDGHISVFPKGIVPSISTWTNIYLNYNWSQGSTLLIFSNIE